MSRAAAFLAFAIGVLASAMPALADPLERLEQAVTQHPGDPDLAWAYARALLDAGRIDEARPRLEQIARRFPVLESEARYELGRIDYAGAAYAAALEAFEARIEAAPLDANARLYRALCLQALGRVVEADRELQVVERIDPELRVEALLLRGVARLEAGDSDAARALLTQVVELDPDGDAADRARALIGPAPAPRQTASSEPRFAAWLRLAAEHDSNVTLDSGGAATAIPTDEKDVRALWSLGFAAQPWRDGGRSLTLGYAYADSSHEDLKGFDQRTHTLLASLSWPGMSPRWSLRLDTLLSDGHLDDDRYSRAYVLRPNALVYVSKRWGVARLFAEMEQRDYHDEPFLGALERDGVTWALGWEQTTRLPLDANGAFTLRWRRTRTSAERGLLPFGGDYDATGIGASTSVKIPLGEQWEIGLRAAATRDRYHHANLTDALTDEGIGTLDPERRRDVIAEASVGLTWLPRPYLRVELRWSGVRQRSNVDAFDYERSIVGLSIGSQHLW